MQLKKYIK